MKLTFYPLHQDINSLKDYLFRAMWYLTPFDDSIEELVFFVNFDVNLKTLYSEKHKYLDSSIPQSIQNFNKLRLIRTEKIEVDNLREPDYVFVSEETLRNDLIKIKQKNNLKFEIVRVDHKNVQYADSFFLRFAEKIPGLHDKYKKISNDKINQYLTKLQSDKVYLFGTGPNFSYTDNIDFSDGLVIACNSMVVSSEIIEKLDPKLFVIADPIFHAGPSSYAESFRSSFLKVLRSRDNPIVVPLRDYHIYVTYFPSDIVERLIPVIFKNESDLNVSQNLNIIKDNYVTTTSNILTLFQLPLASTLGKQIYISGCDGRPLTHNNYFWSHSKSVQINDKMNDIQMAHPAFFNISYDDYYSKHLETLEKWCLNIENNGQSIQNLTPSYIPALQKRTVDKLISYQLPKDDNIELSIIIPLYNAENYLSKAIDSLLAENIDDMEIIIIDDFSEDNSLKVANEYAKRYKNIFVLQNFKTKGVSGARNTGIELSRGKIVGFLDSDDFIYSNSLKKKLETLKNDTKIDIVHSTLKFVGINDEYLDVEVSTRRAITYKDCLYGNPASFNTLLFRRKVLGYLKFDENLSNGEDWLAFAKVLENGLTSTYVAEAQSAYRIHDNSTIIKNFDTHEEKLFSVIEYLHGDNIKEKNKIFQARKFNKFIMTLLSEKEINIVKLLNDLKLKDFLKNDNNFKNRVKVPLVRTFVVPLNTIINIDETRKEIINKNLQLIDLEIGENNFTKELREILSIEASPKPNIKYANKLFREKKYNKSLNIYQYLYETSKFYSFLHINIILTKKRIKNA